MWSYATSQTRSGRSGTQLRSFPRFQRLVAPGSALDGLRARPRAALGVAQSGLVLRYIVQAARDQGLGVKFITDNPLLIIFWRRTCFELPPLSCKCLCDAGDGGLQK
jgi:hypothetical protein